MLLGFLLVYCKPTRHTQRRTPFNLLLVLKFQSTRTTQGMFYLLFILVYLYIITTLYFFQYYFHFFTQYSHNHISLFKYPFSSFAIPIKFFCPSYILYNPLVLLFFNFTPLYRSSNFFSSNSI